MLNSTILIKVKQRLNKLASLDYDNIQDWQIVEAFNKGQVEWCRRQLHGINMTKEGDEQSKRRVDDLQILIEVFDLDIVAKEIYVESINWPDDYFEWKSVGAKAKNECCTDPRPLVIYQTEQDNIGVLLRDENKKPSFEWAETFVTLGSNKVRIYTNGEFEIVTPKLKYYRQPTRIEIVGVQDPYTGLIPTVDVISEFKDDIVELLVDECVKILAGDIELFNQMQRASQAVEQNN